MNREESPDLQKPVERKEEPIDRRDFLKKCALAGLLIGVVRIDRAAAQEDTEEGAAQGLEATYGYKAEDHYYGMGVDVNKCIGCGRCAQACKTENDVPQEPFYFRTWIERYVIQEDGEVAVDSPNGGMEGFPPTKTEGGTLRTFFVPKLCNQCASPPCVQVCPVGATFTTKDGVILVDEDYCIGCEYCIQACPYGARFLNPGTHTADKCTFCYHRVVKGLQPACVEVCPTNARVFGEVRRRNSPLARFVRFNTIQTLKAHLNTESKVYYANLDGEVS